MAAAPARRLHQFAAPWASPYTVDPAYPHHLVNREGKHLFILNKTAWAYFACKDPQGVLDRAKAQGVNVLRVALEGRPYFDVLGIDMWPWGGSRDAPLWNKFNGDYWTETARRIRMAGEAGLGLDIVLYFTLKPGSGEIDAQRPYWKRTLESLGAYANVLTWEVANEYLGNEAFQDAAGSFLAANDAVRRPVCTSDGTTDDAAWPDKRWVGLAVVHTCTGSTPAWPLRDWYQSVARNARSHGKPAFNNETGREKRHRNDDPVHRRKQSWTWCCSGGFWTWHSWEGCEGIDDDKYRAAGGEYLRPLVDYFHSIPFWRMNPNYTAVQADFGVVLSALSTPGREHIAAYLCTEQTGAAGKGRSVRVRLPAGEYTAHFIRPADLSRIGETAVVTRNLGSTVALSLPDFTDDLLISITCLRRTPTASRIKGTG